MYTYKTILATVLLITVPLLFRAAPVFAQNQTTLTIQEGRVLVNGKQLEEDQIPRSLETEDLYVSLSFPSDITPTFELNGYYYSIRDGKLEEVRRQDFPEDETTVVFRNSPNRGAAVAEENREYSSRASGPVAYPRQQVTAQVSAQYNALMQEYMNEVSQRDQQLYRQLITEIELERETQALAQQAREMPEGRERDAKIEQLRELLGRIFDLKQENRREEIQQLEKQLTILNQRLAEREALKAKIIDHRIGELVGTPY